MPLLLNGKNAHLDNTGIGHNSVGTPPPSGIGGESQKFSGVGQYSMFLWLRVLRTDLRFENRVLKKIFSATPFVVGDDTKIWFLRSQNRRAFFGIISPDS